MKILDIRSLIIGFLLSAIAFLTMSFRNDNFEHIVCKSITVNNVDDKEIAYLGPSTEKSGIFYLNNPRGSQVAFLGSNKNTGGMLSIENKYGKNVVYIGEDTEENGLLSLQNKYEINTVSFGSDVEENAGMMDIFNNRGDLVGRLTVVDNEGVFILLDAKGDISFGVPN